MKVYIVYENDSDEGTRVFHVASSFEKAQKYKKKNKRWAFLDIDEVEVDMEYKEGLC